MDKNILFRADSSSTMGTGHIMRDLVLAEKFINSQIIFATQNLSGNINHKIREKAYKIEILESNSIRELINLIQKYAIDTLIIDHYGISYDDEKKIKEETNVNLFVLDDTYEKHFCDVLLNHNISADKIRYDNLVPPKCEVRCGVKYTLLRDEFYQVKIKPRDIKDKKNINVFLAMGGADSQNMNIDILKRLSTFTCNIGIVTTSSNENLSSLQDFVKDKENIDIHLDADNIATLLNDSDIAIVTPSVIVNEVCFMKVPIIAILVVENQRDMFDYLTDKGLLTLEKTNLDTLEIYLDDIFNSDVYNEQVIKIAKLFD